MMRVRGAWLPLDESDGVMLKSGIRYQEHKLKAAIQYCRKARRAVDVGAHCGIWTAGLAQYFERVEAFEPLERHIVCWQRNAGWKQTNHLHECALGDYEGTTGIHLHEGRSGKSCINGAGAYPLHRLDDFGFDDVDFIKIDVEGYEYFVIKGAEQTIIRNRPVMIVEQKVPHARRYGLSDLEAVDYLKGLGMTLKQEIVGDYIMVFE